MALISADGSPHAVRGSCVGYEVRSDLAFRTLRTGGGQPLTVTQAPDLAASGDVLATWHARPGNPFHGRLVQDGSRYGFWASDAGWYIVDPQVPAITMSVDGDPLTRELRLFGVPTSLCVLDRGDISVHAAAVEVDGQAILFAGPSRFGKTTLAAAFATRGHRLLSEDTSYCTTRHGPAVFPGPAAVRLRADVAGALALPGVSVAIEREDRVQLVLDPASRGSGGPVPLRAILLLRHVADAPSLSSVRAEDAIRDLWALTFKLPTDLSTAACFERLTDLVNGVECLDLRRPLTLDQLPTVLDLVERHIAPA